ncbi:hypothetical protein GMORB2_0439 [Geosmithia morbida]|uniref:Tat pathway signal sequence domain protein n=1 Tax=Geosmithia morbida TaxID=1094350 RepID=A0A9P4Z209_9HYPO|nr:uncharacterized protein GMORB2_0439 [Geosmithia morbida]KAF4126702.1 hypothetical protein GMORB2_0439 [Geosmithia morbida]
MTAQNLRWLELNTRGPSDGVSFGMPWPKGLYYPGQDFVIQGSTSRDCWSLDSREIAFWSDGSLKWTAHSISAEVEYSEGYTVRGATAVTSTPNDGLYVSDRRVHVLVTTSLGLRVSISRNQPQSFLESVSINGRTVCSGGTIVASVSGETYSTTVKQVSIENCTFSRVVVRVSGAVVAASGQEHLPFDVRVYVHSHSQSLRIVHSFVHDLEGHEPLTSLGIRFTVPLNATELHNRHVRLGGSGGGILKEEVRGLSGLRFGPSTRNRIDQTAGRPVTLNAAEWEHSGLTRGLASVPSWSHYSLAQLSSDGHTIKKRTRPGCSWVKVTGGGRADGTSYVGSAVHGGLAVGMSNFWERYPTQIELADLTSPEGAITMWLYSPLAEPLETMPYHDGLGLDTYEKQLEGLNVTYEDYEPGFATANGIARSNQLFIRPFSATPSNEQLSSFSALVREPARLVPTADHMYSTGVFHGCWSPDYRILGHVPSKRELAIEERLDLLFNYYKEQVEQHRWYGFWDHGDVQHTYDSYRHAWRYDVGGYAWDNSELSTDMWLWLYALHTGRADVFRMAEAMIQHTGEVDVYHAGEFKGFGTRHGVQHFSDSSKQLRISHALFRRIYYYLSGDERTGDLLSELEGCQFALLKLDSHRKVQQHAPVPNGFAMVNIGLDCGPLAASWLTAWERRNAGWEHSRDLLIGLFKGLSGTSHGIANNAVLLDPETGEVRECAPPTPDFAISHLSMLFGFPEIFTEALDYAKEEYSSDVETFKKKVWLPYCRAYNGGPAVQMAEYGREFPPTGWNQSHSTLTALAAAEQGSGDLARAAWDQFHATDGYTEAHDWTIVRTRPPECLADGREASWNTTNETARYGVSALVNLANIRKFL